MPDTSAETTNREGDRQEVKSDTHAKVEGQSSVPVSSTTLENMSTQQSRMDELDDFIVNLSLAITKITKDHPRYHTLAYALGDSYLELFQLGKDSSNLDSAILFLRLCLQYCPESDGDSIVQYANSATKALLLRDRLVASPVDLDHTIRVCRTVLNNFTDRRPQSTIISHLVQALCRRYQRSGQLEDLNEAIRSSKESLELHPDPGPLRRDALITLASATTIRCQVTHDTEEFHSTLDTLREILSLCPPGDADRSVALNNVAVHLQRAYERFGEVDDLVHAIRLYEENLTLRPPGHLDRCRTLSNLGSALGALFTHSVDLSRLTAGISYLREAVDLCPPGHENRWSALNDLSEGLLMHFEHTGSVDDLDEAVDSCRSALDLIPSTHSDRKVVMQNHGGALCTRFATKGDVQDGERALRYIREALALFPDDHPAYPISSYNLGRILCLYFQRFGHVDDLSDAILNLHRCIERLPSKTAAISPLAMIELSNALRLRFEVLGNPRDLDEAIELQRSIVTTSSSRHFYAARNLGNLASSLQVRFEDSAQTTDFEEAMLHLRNAVAQSDDFRILNQLATAMISSFSQSGVLSLLDQAIEAHIRSLRYRPPEHPGIPSSLNNLAAALELRFAQTGRLDDLEESIRSLRQALSLCPPGNFGRPHVLYNLVSALQRRHILIGLNEALEETLRLAREDAHLCPPGSHGRYFSLKILAKALKSQYSVSHEKTLLLEAEALQREALSLRSPGHPDHSVTLTSLAHTLTVVFFDGSDTPRDIALLNEALQNLHSAFTSLPSNDPSRFETAFQLSYTFRLRHQELHALSDLEEAARFNRMALEMVQPEHPRVLDIKHHLAQICMFQGSFDLAYDLYEKASRHEAASAVRRADAAAAWAQAVRLYDSNNTEMALRAYHTALTLLHDALVIVPSLTAQRALLSRTTVRSDLLAMDAAAAAIYVERGEFAVEMLELGRTVLWTKLRGYKHETDGIQAQDPDLSASFKRITSQLESLVTTPSDASGGQSYQGAQIVVDNQTLFEARLSRHRLLSAELDITVERIRGLDGFADFRRPPSYSSLVETAGEGPVLIFNVSRYRSDIIILLPSGRLEIIPLAGSTFTRMADLAGRFARARYAAPDAGPRSRELQRTLFPSELRSILKALWKYILSPAVKFLTSTNIPKHSHIWLCPTSHLSSLPLHAAGPYNGTPGLADLYVVSYTSSISALKASRHAREVAAHKFKVEQQSPARLLFISEPGVTKPLQTLDAEMHAVQQELKTSIDTLEHTSKESVLGALQTHPWVHFACHGHLHPQDPFSSSFELSGNQRLTLLEIIQARPVNPELAFLAACHSATGADDDSTPDEVIHLATAMQCSGFRSVVGTMWEMVDVDGPVVAREFYKHLQEYADGKEYGFRESARALNDATKALRDTPGVTIDRWVNFVHIGA